jgi:regulatory protein
MALVTQISEQKRRPHRRNVYLDGVFAFGCNINVIAKFRLRVGQQLTAAEIEQIQLGAVKQECFDAAIRFIESRLHSRAELRRKLARREYGAAVLDATLDDLARLGYVNDARFAHTKALSAAQHKHHGRRRAMVELFKVGVVGETARRAVEEVYEATDSTGIARALAMKQRPRLLKLDGIVARRRLIGMLLRRGFDYDLIRPVVDEVLGQEAIPE